MFTIRHVDTYRASPKHPVQEYVLDKPDGVAVTLPPATGSGFRHRFYVDRAVTSNAHTITATEGDVINGAATVAASDGDIFACADKTIISLNGGTKGGLGGDVLELVDIAEGKWSVRGSLHGSGTVASPFS